MYCKQHTRGTTKAVWWHPPQHHMYCKQHTPGTTKAIWWHPPQYNVYCKRHTLGTTKALKWYSTTQGVLSTAQIMITYKAKKTTSHEQMPTWYNGRLANLLPCLYHPPLYPLQVCIYIASFQGSCAGEEEREPSTLFVHAPSFLGNLYTIPLH